MSAWIHADKYANLMILGLRSIAPFKTNSNIKPEHGLHGFNGSDGTVGVLFRQGDQFDLVNWPS